jgi:hypothetical protein
MAFGFIGDIVEQVGEVLLPRGTRGAAIGYALGGAPGAALGSALTSDIASGRKGQEAVTTTQARGASETSLSGAQTDRFVYQPTYTAGLPRLPTPTTTQPGMRDMAGTVLDIVYDIGDSFFGNGNGQQICGTAQKPLVSVRQKCDGSQCLSVTRKQQHQLKQMVMYLGINGTAEYVGLSVQELAGLLVKKFPPRRKGISAAQLRNAKRVNRQIMGMAKQLQDACKTTTRRR